MPSRTDSKQLVPVRFYLLAQQRQNALINVNRFLPLINYKRNIENTAKIDLYGRQLVFQVKTSNGRVNIEYAQEALEKGVGLDAGEIPIEVVFQQFGG